MQRAIIISGFGGQGVLFAGQLLAYTALDQGEHVTWFPSYGPEMRGGTAHCTVIISDDEIGSPIVRHPSIVIVMNIPSLEKYEPILEEDGLLIVNSSLVDRIPQREDIRTVMVPAVEIAEELGNKRLANLVLIGAMLMREPVFTLGEMEASLDQHIPERHRSMLQANFQALRRGWEVAEKAAAVPT